MTAPAFMYTSEPWAALSFGRPIFAPAFKRKRMSAGHLPSPLPPPHDGSRPCLGGGRKRGIHQRALGRSRGGFTSKIHCLGDARGRPISFDLTPGEAADCKSYDTLIELPERAPGALVADKAYDSDAIRNDLKQRGIRAVIPPKSNRTKTICYDDACRLASCTLCSVTTSWAPNAIMTSEPTCWASARQPRRWRTLTG